jgi:hypothetical protein
MKKIVLFSLTVNLLGAEICVAEMGQALKMNKI